MTAPPVVEVRPPGPPIGDQPPPRSSAAGGGRWAAALAALVAGSAAVSMAAGLFDVAAGVWLAGLTGLAIGVGLTTAAYRSRPPSALQHLVLPVAALAGALLGLLGPGGPSVADLPGRVADAVAGGLGGHAVPLDSGWRVLIVVAFAVVGAASASLAMASGRVALAVVVPVPLLFAAALTQPPGHATAKAIATVVLVAAAIALAFWAEAVGQGTFDARLAARHAALVLPLLLAVAAGTALVGRTGSLLPAPRGRSASSTRTPGEPPPDQLLFRVKGAASGPWRLTALDTYRDGTFVETPGGRERVADLGARGIVPAVAPHPATAPATFTIVGLGGTDLPTPPQAVQVSSSTASLGYDRRAEAFRSLDRLQAGVTYTVDVASPPSRRELVDAPPPSGAARDAAAAPPVPREVAALLGRAPPAPWDRADYVLRALHASVQVVNGAARPVSPERIGDMLAGATATPSEVTVAEVLLARWSGVPARIGVGYVGGERRDDEWEVRPAHEAEWLETYVEGYGWVPFASLPTGESARVQPGPSRAEGAAAPSQDVQLTLYVPVRLRSIVPVSTVVGFWTLAALGVAGTASALWWLAPGPIKVFRGWRRRHWASTRGTRARIAVAYAELRDRATDLGAPGRTATPLQFLAAVDDDDEHTELAWLVTRALWGDLQRDQRETDADAAEEMAASVRRRVARAQPAPTRLLALVSRRSLRTPYAREIPNLSGSRRRERRSAVVVVAVGLTVAVAAAALVASTFGRTQPGGPSAAVIPQRLAPATVGGLALRREPTADAGFAEVGHASLVAGGRVLTVRRGDDVAGYLEVAALDRGVNANGRRVRFGILRHLGGGRFQPLRTPAGTVYVATLEDTTFRVWFAPGGRLFEVLVSFSALPEADGLFQSLLSYQQTGRLPGTLSPASAASDPRRGGDPS